MLKLKMIINNASYQFNGFIVKGSNMDSINHLMAIEDDPSHGVYKFKLINGYQYHENGLYKIAGIKNNVYFLNGAHISTKTNNPAFNKLVFELGTRPLLLHDLYNAIKYKRKATSVKNAVTTVLNPEQYKAFNEALINDNFQKYNVKSAIYQLSIYGDSNNDILKYGLK